ncbi:MAG: biosynthetic-type acetolactate synthase large subunit [Clostridia bacterium]
MLKSGAQIVAECLIEQKVDVVFGYPGGQIINVYDALYEYSDKIRHILTSHEQGAAHAAEGYAKSSGKVGVVIATSGPGATNLVTGIADAYMDSVPIVAITGNVPLELLGRDSFQEVDITGITMPITKHNYIVKDIKKLAKIIREAFVIANTGRKGPVLIDIPKNVTTDKCEFVPMKIKKPVVKKEEIQNLDEVVEIIKAAKRPVIFAGGGVISSDATKELSLFAEKMQIPVTLSFMGLGAFSPKSELYLGMLGMHGSIKAAMAIKNADVLIAIGTRFSDRVIGNRSLFAKNAKIIHIDIDKAEIDKNIPTYTNICADAKKVLAKLIDLLPKTTSETHLLEIEEYSKKEAKMNLDKDLVPKLILKSAQHFTNSKTIFVTDVGQHQMWAAQYLDILSPRKFISSGGLGTMGFGLGAAIGAAIANPNDKVVLITGDGSFHMNLNELATAITNNLNITIIVFNNGVLGMVRQWQKLFFNSHFSNTTLNRKTDFVKLIEAFGGSGYRILNSEDIKKYLKLAINTKGVTLLDCVINEDDNVLPMIPPGKSVEEIITSM